MALPLGELAGASPTERASHLSQSRCTAISRLFVRAILSQCKSCLSASLPSPSLLRNATSPKGRGFGRPEGANPLSEIATPRGAGYFAKFRLFSDSSFEIEHRKLCEVGLSCEVGTSQMTRTSQTLRSSNIIRIYIKYSEHRKMFHHSRTA